MFLVALNLASYSFSVDLLGFIGICFTLLIGEIFLFLMSTKVS